MNFARQIDRARQFPTVNLHDFVMPKESRQKVFNNTNPKRTAQVIKRLNRMYGL